MGVCGCNPSLSSAAWYKASRRERSELLCSVLPTYQSPPPDPIHIPSPLPFQPKHDYENWTCIESARDKVQAEGKQSPPTPSAKVRGKQSCGHVSQCIHA